MDDQQTDKNYLLRLVRLFMSLATLADSASHRSARIRFAVFCILRPMALYARLWLRRELYASGLEMPDLPPLLRGFSPAAARRLAAHFCAVAQILEVVARTECQPQAYSDGWTLYGLLKLVLSMPTPIRINDDGPTGRCHGFRALDSPLG